MVLLYSHMHTHTHTHTHTPVHGPGISDVSHCLWTPFAEQAVAALYRLAEHPDHLAKTLLQKLVSLVFKPTASGNSLGHVEGLDGDFSPVSTSTQGL